MADSTSGTFNVDDCAKISTDISTILDVEDPIEKEYTLEVSSPGIDRPLTRLKDFEDWCGYQVKLETLELVDGQRRFKGNLLGVDNDSVVLELNGKKLKIDFYLLSDAKLILTDTLIKDVLKNRKDFEKFDKEKFDEIDETVPEEGED
jgi:ribosome maturation factor RimP